MKRYVRCVRRGNGSRGFAMMYVLLLVLAAGIAAAVLAPRCASWYHAALVRYEADCLVSDLHLLQQLSRTAAVYPIEVPSDLSLARAAPRLVFENDKDAYYILRMGKSSSGISQRQRFLYHKHSPDIIISADRKEIAFDRNGGTNSSYTTIEVSYDGEYARRKLVIIDSVGRIRVEDVHGR